MTGAFPYRRVVRRELHSPRSVLAIVVAVLLIIACAYLGTEIMLGMLGQRPLLASPSDMVRSLGDLGRAPVALLVLIGAALVVFGILVLIGALSPGRRARHELPADRAVVVVDDEVIASALARHAAHAAGVHPDRTRVSVSKRRAVVRLTPASGIPANRGAVAASVDEQLETLRLIPSIRPSIDIASSGVVGA